MSDPTELREALRRVTGIGWRGNEAADLIEVQAARIAELESKRGPITYDCADHGEWNARIVSGCPECIIEARKRIAELEAKPKAKRLVWDETSFERIAKTPVGEFRVFPGKAEFSVCRIPYADYMLLLGEFPTESEARAACQQEFDRIHAEMTEAPMVTT